MNKSLESMIKNWYKTVSILIRFKTKTAVKICLSKMTIKIIYKKKNKFEWFDLDTKFESLKSKLKQQVIDIIGEVNFLFFNVQYDSLLEALIILDQRKDLKD